MLTIKEAQQRFLAGKMSLRWWYKQLKHLPHIRQGKGKILINPDDVEAFVASLQRQPAQPKKVLQVFKYFPK